MILGVVASFDLCAQDLRTDLIRAHNELTKQDQKRQQERDKVQKDFSEEMKLKYKSRLGKEVYVLPMGILSYETYFPDEPTCKNEGGKLVEREWKVEEKYGNGAKEKWIKQNKERCQCTPKKNPNYKPQTTPSNTSTPVQNDFNSSSDLGENTTQITGSIFDAPSAREQNRWAEPNNNSGAPALDLSGLGDYLGEEISANSKGSGRPVIELEGNEIIVPRKEYVQLPPLPNPKIRGIEDEMQNAIEELKKIERYCKAYPADCEHYAEKRKEAEQKLEEAKNKLAELRGEEYKNEKEQQEQELKKYKELLGNCYPWERAGIENKIKEVSEKLNDINKKIDGIQDEITRKENSLKEKASQMSWENQKEEVAKERLNRIEEQLAKGEITKPVAASMMTGALADLGVAKATNAYVQSKEVVVDFVRENKEIIIDAGEFVTQTGVSLVGAALALETGGSSVVGARIVNYEISVYANQLRGQGTGEAAWNAAKDVPANWALGEVTVIKKGKISLEDVKDAGSFGVSLTGLKFSKEK